MWSFFISKNRFSYLVVAALIAAGLYSLLMIPRESTPEVEIPVGIVSTVLPGAEASDIESLVTNEIERSLLGSLNDVSSISSVSSRGISSITVEFNASADIDEAIDELETLVDSLQGDLPADAEDSQVTQVDFVDQPIMNIAVASDVSDVALRELADELEAALEATSGVARVSISGIPERQVTVLTSQAALLQYNLTLDQLAAELRASNQTFPAGQVRTDDTVYNVAFTDNITAPSDVANTPLRTQSGAVVYLREVAEVSTGLAPASSLARLSVDGAPSQQSLTVSVFKQSGGDITRTTRNVRETLSTLQTSGGLLETASVAILFDSGQDIIDDLIQLSTSGLQTVVLVMIILVLALGWREALIAGSAIPLSFLIGFIGLYLTGNTINFLSLFALILGIGILVDSSIVMVEAINKLMKQDEQGDKVEAAVRATKEFAAPLTAGTLTTVSMFAGLFIVSGVTGQFIASIPFTLIFVLFASLFVALAVIPLLAATFLRRRSVTTLEQKQTLYAATLENWYQQKLRALLQDTSRQKKFLWTLRGLLASAIMLPVLGFVTVTFFEAGDVPFLYVELEAPTGTSLQSTDIIAREIEEVLYTVPEIEAFQTTVGSGSQFGSGGSGSQVANIFVDLKDERETGSGEITAQLQEKVRDIVGGKVTVSQPENGPPTGAAINVRFLGDNLQELASVASEAALVLGEIDGATNITTNGTNNATEYVIDVDDALAASYGLSVQEVSRVARGAVFGTEATTLQSLTDDIPVRVRMSFTATDSYSTPVPASASDLGNILIRTQNGNTVSLGALAEIRLRESQASISHQDGERVYSLSADVTSGANAREVQAEFLEQLASEGVVPDSVTLSTGGGESEESNRAFIEMFVALIVGILLMIGVLALQFNSYLHTRYVLTILPYSLVGILYGLWLTGNALSFPSLMGFIALSGIVVNNSILLIDMMNTKRKERPDMAMIDVVTLSAGSRLRPILLTTVTTVIGMIPLLFADDIWAPLAYAVMFGLLFSVVVTLVLIPIIYYRKPGKVG